MYRRAVPPIRNLLSRAACKRFWEEATLDALLAMTEDDIVTRLTSLAAKYSSDGSSKSGAEFLLLHLQAEDFDKQIC